VTDRSARGQGAVIAASIVAFLGLGLPEGGLGVVFPAIRETFDLPVSGVGLLLVPLTGGYIAESLVNARLTRRLGVARTLMLAAAASATGATLYVIGPSVAVLVAGSFFLGLSAGALDVGLNAYASRHLQHRVLAFMHAGFGVGATLAPFGVTLLLRAGGSWRVAYACLAALQVALGITWFRLRHSFRTFTPSATDEPHVTASPDHPDELVVAFEGDVAETVADVARFASADGEDAPRRLIRSCNVVLFFLYTGTEASTGVLVATLLRSRGMEEATAGLLAALYWAALATGRVLVGVLGPRASPRQALRVAMIGAPVGLVLVWGGGTGLAAVGLILVGFSLAPVFPSLVGLTPSRVGAQHTTAALGHQLAAAAVGVAALPFAIGLVADRRGVEAIAPCLVAVGLAFVAVQLVTSRLAGEHRAALARP
jgi:fucose permease